DARHLPVRYVEHGTVGSGGTGQALDFQIDFSSWGEAVDVSAPPGAIAFSTLGAGNGGGSPTTGSTVLALFAPAVDG
ncbi:MAG: hypothetical protein ACYDB3_06450, partial [Acidimicrobiales bacterium]